MPKQFTVEQANSTLPLVRRIVEDIVVQYRRWQERIREFEVVTANSTAERPAPRAEELQREAQALASEIEGFVGELTELGLEFKGYDLGLVDFPTEVAGRPAYLCWKLGEPSVAYWHEIGAGYAARQPINPRAVA